LNLKETGVTQTNQRKESLIMKPAQLISSILMALAISAASAQAQAPLPYGPPINLEQAKKVMAAAEAEALKNKWNVVITIVDSAGHMVLMQRLDNTQFGSIEIARQKAWTSVAYRRPTAVFQDAIAKGGEGLRLLKLEGTPLEGGIPIEFNGTIIGGIGVSGVTSQQDAQIALAGIAALTSP
jgi:glc operon protein GlcG